MKLIVIYTLDDALDILNAIKNKTSNNTTFYKLEVIVDDENIKESR